MEFEEVKGEIALLIGALEDMHKEFLRELRVLIDDYLSQIKH